MINFHWCEIEPPQPVHIYHLMRQCNCSQEEMGAFDDDGTKMIQIEGHKKKKSKKIKNERKKIGRERNKNETGRHTVKKKEEIKKRAKNTKTETQLDD